MGFGVAAASFEVVLGVAAASFDWVLVVAVCNTVAAEPADRFVTPANFGTQEQLAVQVEESGREEEEANPVAIPQIVSQKAGDFEFQTKAFRQSFLKN